MCLSKSDIFIHIKKFENLKEQLTIAFKQRPNLISPKGRKRSETQLWYVIIFKDLETPSKGRSSTSTIYIVYYYTEFLKVDSILSEKLNQRQQVLIILTSKSCSTNVLQIFCYLLREQFGTINSKEEIVLQCDYFYFLKIACFEIQHI